MTSKRTMRIIYKNQYNMNLNVLFMIWYLDNIDYLKIGYDKNGTSNHYLHRSHDIVKKLISLHSLPMVSSQPHIREMEVMLRFHAAKVAKLFGFELYCLY